MRAVKEQEEILCPLWEISVDRQGCTFRKTARGAAEFVTDTAARRLMRGHTRPLSIVRLDTEDNVVWDASSDVQDVLRASGWPHEQSAGRDAVIGLIEAILVD